MYLSPSKYHGQSWAERRSLERRSGAPLRKSGAGAGAPLLFHTWSGSGSAAPFLGGAVGNLALRAPAPVKFQIIDILYLFFSNNL